MSALIYQGLRLSFGILYPAYSSFKAVRSKNVKEYVKWMMYWIVFAIYSFVEAFTDYVLVWLPFYFELKICFVLWLVSPATKGAGVIYRKVVHPQLLKREKEIDDNISKATDQGYAALLTLGSRGFNFATSVVLSTALKGSSRLTDQLQKSFSLNDLSRGDNIDYRPRRQLMTNMSLNEEDEELENRLMGERYRMEMGERENLDDIDREIASLPVLEPTDAQKIEKRKQIESTLREVMSGSSPSLAQSLVGSVQLPRKYKPISKKSTDPTIPEAATEPTPQTPSSPDTIDSSVGTAPTSSKNVRSTGSSASSVQSASSTSSSTVTPSTSTGPTVSTSVTTTTSTSAPLSSSGSSITRRLKLGSLFSSHSSSKHK